MNHSLYISTLKGFQLGLLDQNYNWLEYLNVETEKSADIVHSAIFKLLKRHSLKLSDKLTLFYLSGPGSYTGIRVASGIASVLELMKGTVISFPVYLVPFLSSKIESYNYIAPAFKGEYFWYKHEGENITQGESKIIKLEEFNTSLPCYSFAEVIPNRNSYNVEKILRISSKEVFSAAQKLNLRFAPIYFRKPEDEFRNQTI